MKKLFKFLRVGGKKLFLQAFISMLLVRLGLLLLPFNQLQELIQRAKGLEFLAHDRRNVTIKAIVIAVQRSGRYGMGNAKCLARALTTGILMSIYGFPYKMNIGVAKGEHGNLEAHAWVESKGVIIIGNLPDLTRYTAMSSPEEGLII